MGGGSSGGSGSSSGTQTNIIKYAGYIESHHGNFLDDVSAKKDAVIDDSPFSGATDIDCDVGFFGANYTIASFPALYDMFGKFMAGLDIDALYNEIYEDTVNSPETNNLVTAEAALMDDDIEANVLPRIALGARDINSVMSSTFVIARSVVEDARIKALSRFSGELKFRLIEVATRKWQQHLQWNHQVVMTYAEVMKLYFSAKMDVDDYNYSMSAKDKLWPFTVLEYERAALGALQGARTSTKSVAGASDGAKFLSGMASGAAMGTAIGGPGWGTAIGAAAGGIAGLFG